MPRREGCPSHPDVDCDEVTSQRSVGCTGPYITAKCYDCDVEWKKCPGTRPYCWNCGQLGAGGSCYVPILGRKPQ